MGNFLDYDGSVMRFLGRITDMIILNVLFIICSIPVVTIGASFTALYTVTLRMARNEESYIAKSFFKAFKENFKISTLAWLIMAFAGIVLYMDHLLVPGLPSSITGIFQILIYVLAAFYAIVFLYVFPYIARFENTLKNTFKNAVLIGIASLPYTLLMLVIFAAFIAFSLFAMFSIVGFFWIIIGFSLLAYVLSLFFRKVFYKFEPHEEDGETLPDSGEGGQA